MDENHRNKHKQFLNLNASKYRGKTRLSKSDLKTVFHGLINLLELPYPPSELIQYFLHPNVVSYLLIQVLNSDNLTADDRFALHDSFDLIHKAIKEERSNYSINFRILAPGGLYPNIELDRGGCKYSFINQLPVLITKNRIKKDIFSDSSIINWLTRNELRFATSVMCAPEIGFYHFHFTGYNSLYIDFNCTKLIPKELIIYFLRELLDIHRRFTPIGVRFWHRKPLQDVNEYEFSDYLDSIQYFNLLFDNFSIRDDLLLRTCNYFVKAIMHWDNQINIEEAITNTFFCLEGCLHLIQKKHGEYAPNLNIKLLKKIFKENIPFGENVFDYIQEGYEKRISLIHAEPQWGADWDPFITSEDYYDYFKICKSLINYILIDRHLDY